MKRRRKVNKLEKFIKSWTIPVLFYGTIAMVMIICLCVCASESKIESHTSTTTTTTTISTTTTTTSAATTSLKKMTVVATAYCPCEECSGGYGRRTSTGKIAKECRTIAVDPKVIPYGTAVIIDGNTYIAEDCGGAIKGNKIDIFFNSHEEVEKFGKQVKEIVIL